MRKLPKTLVRVEIRTSGVFLVYVRGLCSDPFRLGVVSSCLVSPAPADSRQQHELSPGARGQAVNHFI